MLDDVPSLLELIELKRRPSKSLSALFKAGTRSQQTLPGFRLSSHSWLLLLLEEHLNDVSLIFHSYKPDEQGTIDALHAKDFIREVLALLGVAFSSKDLFLYDRMVENRFRVTRNGHPSYLKVTFPQTLALADEWAKKDLALSVRVPEVLQKKIKTFERLRQSHPHRGLEQILEQLRELKHDSVSSDSKEARAVRQIFSFYARQLQMLGRAPSFENIHKNNQVWNISKFQKFCADFGLVGVGFSQKTAGSIFKRCASNGLQMNEAQFFEALQHIAQCLHSRSETPLQQLYSALGLADPRQYHAKLKGFGLPFSSQKTGFRLPEYDLSKRYRTRDLREAKERVKKWKETKKLMDTRHTQSRASSFLKRPQVRALKAGYLNNMNAITWKQLNSMRHSEFIRAEELSSLFAGQDLTDFISKPAA